MQDRELQAKTLIIWREYTENTNNNKKFPDQENEDYREREIWIDGYGTDWDEYMRNNIKISGRIMKNYKSKMQEQLHRITRMHDAKNKSRKYDKCGQTD